MDYITYFIDIATSFTEKIIFEILKSRLKRRWKEKFNEFKSRLQEICEYYNCDIEQVLKISIHEDQIKL